MYCDAHIHLLPNMDNGPSTDAEAVAMLRIMREAGCRQAILTPHFYADRESPKLFLARRKESFTALLRAAKPIGRFRFALSAEVSLLPGISHLPPLERLMIPNTRYLPFELPLGKFDGWMMRELAYIIQKRKIRPIICQTERYFLLYPAADYERLTTLPYSVLQFSAASLLNEQIRREIFRLVREGRAVAIASNAHNAYDRTPASQPLFEQLAEENASTMYKMLSLRTLARFHEVFT